MALGTVAAGQAVVLFHLPIDGHLTQAVFDKHFGSFAARMKQGARHAVIVDASKMTGYDASVREAFVTWYRAHKERVYRVGVVTDRAMWRLVVATVGMATGGILRAFDTRAEAENLGVGGLS